MEEQESSLEEMMAMQQALQRKQIIAGNKAFLKMVEQTIKQLEDLKPEDRLKYANGIRIILNAMGGSLQGWAKWCNLAVMDDMTEEELKKCFEIMKPLCIEWLKCDYELTESKTIEMEKEENGEEPSTKGSPKERKKPNLYVA